MGDDPIRWVFEYVDFDGDLDLLLHYHTRDTTIAVGDTEAWIFGDLYDQRQNEGVDSIKTPKKYLVREPLHICVWRVRGPVYK
jgi:hypothetical protein